MDKKKYKTNAKWYQPFRLVKENKELQKIINQLLLIIDDYKDELENIKK